MIEKTKIVVAGSGPAGIAEVIELQEAGLPPGVIPDRAKYHALVAFKAKTTTHTPLSLGTELFFSYAEIDLQVNSARKALFYWHPPSLITFHLLVKKYKTDSHLNQINAAKEADKLSRPEPSIITLRFFFCNLFTFDFFTEQLLDCATQ